MVKTISLAEQVDILFKHGRERGQSVTYRAVAEAVGETANNIFRIHHGQNLNPGLRTLSALVEYFDTDLGYISCKTKAECLSHLNQTIPHKTLNKLTMRAEGISPAGIKTILQVVDLVRQAEGVKDKAPKGRELLRSRVKRVRISRGRRAR
jgi:transcriptional regulator with XRE-family HTH domain